MKRLLLVGAALGIYASCGGACTLQGVECVVRVTVAVAGGERVPDGQYVLRVHSDTLDMTASCPFRNGVPSEPCGAEWGLPGWYVDVVGVQARFTFNGPLGKVPSLAYELSRDGSRLQQGEPPPDPCGQPALGRWLRRVPEQLWRHRVLRIRCDPLRQAFPCFR